MRYDSERYKEKSYLDHHDTGDFHSVPISHHPFPSQTEATGIG